ncbi:permease prefix domain 1-containing protein [Asanoa ishikariensis]|uniref:permease prefix domain 1-containing protein n=1 Tax=Asanoa ishikariensis TaxID=137265 RepID=UPI00115FB761|nr:permease prefix domain 1-containing protein [Asanoa ishikariensis]
MTAIDSYVRELDRRLHGPRRRKADMIVEVRDGLRDAADAVRAGSPGVSPAEAERQAVEEFGPVPDLAPEFQTELAVTQAWRTAWVFAVALPLVMTVTTLMWRGGGSGVEPGAAYLDLARATDLFLIVASVSFAVALLALHVLARRAASPVGLVRTVGVAALCTVLAMMVSGLFLTMGAPGGGISLWGALVGGLPTLPGYGLLFYLGVRCLRLTRPRRPGAGRPSRRPAPVPSA